MSEFFLEIFSEEIPANLQRAARISLLENFTKLFEEKKISFKKSLSYSVPNRLIIFLVIKYHIKDWQLDPYYKVLEELFTDFTTSDTFDNYKIRFIGSRELLPETITNTIDKVESIRVTGEKELTIALGYGGRQEILDAIKSLLEEKYPSSKSSKELVEEITDEEIRKHLYSPNSPDIDLVIRTSGEARLSGFLLWQSAYSEFVFNDVYWPEFRKIDFLRCLREYIQRERRFGQ